MCRLLHMQAEYSRVVLCDNRKDVINRSNKYYRNRDNDFFSIVIGVNCCEMIDSL